MDLVGLTDPMDLVDLVDQMDQMDQMDLLDLLYLVDQMDQMDLVGLVGLVDLLYNNILVVLPDYSNNFCNCYRFYLNSFYIYIYTYDKYKIHS
jgi:hypothetical protein